MDYFTRAWAQAYCRIPNAKWHSDPTRNGSILYLPSLPEALAYLATEHSLHDGLIRRAVLDHQSVKLILELRVGGNQLGYFDLDITYGGVTWSLIDLDALARRARDRRTEILYDEIDLAGKGLFEHRILFWPEDEICFRFTTIGIAKAACADRRFDFLGDPFVEEEP